MSELTLDGSSVPFEEGETLYQVARRHGDTVPTLCYDDRLAPFGACRLCVVEVEGVGKPLASCTTMAQEGMVVRTRTEALETHRKTLVDLVVSDDPLARQQAVEKAVGAAQKAAGRSLFSQNRHHECTQNTQAGATSVET